MWRIGGLGPNGILGANWSPAHLIKEVETGTLDAVLTSRMPCALSSYSIFLMLIFLCKDENEFGYVYQLSVYLLLVQDFRWW